MGQTEELLHQILYEQPIQEYLITSMIRIWIINVLKLAADDPLKAYK